MHAFRWLASLATLLLPLVGRAMADNLTDIRDWLDSGLPMAAAWNCEGTPTRWHVAQVQAGRRLIPSVFVPNYDAFEKSCLNPRQIAMFLDPEGDALRWLAANNLPLCLRTNNISNAFERSKRYRGGDFSQQPIVYRRLPDGTLDQIPRTDPLAGNAAWETEGRLWGGSPWVKRIGEFHPNPPWLMFVENNEGQYDEVRNYVAGGQWKPALDTLSVRMSAWVKVDGTAVPDDAVTLLWQSRSMQYESLYREFESAAPWPPVPMRTAAYGGSMVLQSPTVPRDVDEIGYDPEGLSYDALSPAQYITPKNGNLTSVWFWSQISNKIPAWEWSERRNLNAYREVSVSINEAGALAAANSVGVPHGAVVPEVFSGFCGWLLWSTREPSVPSLLRHWNASSTKPDAPFSTDPRLAGVTHGDYILAVCRAVDRICENVTLRDFWQRGKPVVAAGVPAHPTNLYRYKFDQPDYPRLGEPDTRWRVLDCDANDPRSAWRWGTIATPAGEKQNGVTGSNKVWACATELDGRWLIYGFTPCKLGVVRLTIPGAGDVSFDFAGEPFQYRLYAPPKTGLVEIPLEKMR